MGTRAVHRPSIPTQPGEPIAPPIDPSSTYAFDDADLFARATADHIGSGYIYARWANPTVDAFEAALADLEGAEGAEAFASGMAAIAAIFLALCGQGDRVVATRQLYGNSYSLLANRLPRYGIEAVFCDLDDYDAIEKSLDGARLLHCETIGNPRIQVADLHHLAALAKGAGVPLVVDNTFASPVLCRPLEHGASLVVHSATKFLGGHHDLLGGIVCGNEELLGPIREVGRDFGPTMSPFTAWLCLRGLSTLPLRVERSSTTALTVAHFLAGRPDIERVSYPALDGDHSKPFAESLLGGRGGGTLGFDIAGGRARAGRFQDLLEVVSPASSLGGTHSLIVHAASITHTQLSAAELAAAGIGEGFCRLSIGLEDPEDLIADLDGALARSA